MQPLTFAPKTLMFAVTLSVSILLPMQAAIANTATKQQSMESVQAQKTQAFLGVAIEPIPVALQHQLNEIVPQNQGILVRNVVPDSPAEKAQLQAFDILLSFNDQKLFSTKQLTALVRSSQKGDEVTLKIVRNGQVKEIKANIDEQTVKQPNKHQRHPMSGYLGQHHSGPYGMGRHHPMWNNFPDFDMPSWNSPFSNELTLGQDWDNFQSLSVTKLQDNQYQANLEILDKKGDKQTFQFKGSREEIQEQIQQAEQLPQKQKQQLMRLLSAKNKQLFPDLGQWLPEDIFSGSLLEGKLPM